MISILSVNYNGLDWMKLLVNSIRKFTTVSYEIIIVDNASEDGSAKWLAAQKDVKAIFMEKNIGHGRGLDLAIKSATYHYCLVLDIDVHFQRNRWDADLIRLYEKEEKIKLVAAGGRSEKKPIHACFMFFEREFFIESEFLFVAKEYDVGRKIYFDIIDLGYETFRIFSGYENEKREKFYKDAWGDEYYIKGNRFLYHNWYATRIYGQDKVDNLTKKEFDMRARNVFQHPLVKEILR